MTVLEKKQTEEIYTRNLSEPVKSYNEPKSEQYCRTCLIKILLTAKLINFFMINQLEA